MNETIQQSFIEDLQLSATHWPMHHTLSWWYSLMSYYFIFNQSNPLTIDIEWAQVEKKHPLEWGFKGSHLENISLAKLLEGIVK